MVETPLPVVARFRLFIVISNFNACIRPIRQIQKHFTWCDSSFFGLWFEKGKRVLKLYVHIIFTPSPQFIRPLFSTATGSHLEEEPRPRYKDYVSWTLPSSTLGRTVSIFYASYLYRQTIGKALTQRNA